MSCKNCIILQPKFHDLKIIKMNITKENVDALNAVVTVAISKEDYSSILMTKIDNNKFEIIKDKTLLHKELKEILIKTYK